MGFDTGEKEFLIPVSDTQAYKQFGNAVVVPVVREIAKHMKQHVLSVKAKEEIQHKDFRQRMSAVRDRYCHS